jgi:hypothetical protein
MKAFFFKLILLLWFTMAFMPHPIHISITEINHNPKTQSLEITHKIFIDDLETILEKKHGKRLFLASEKEHPDALKQLKEYLETQFSLELNGKKLAIQFLGREYENEAVWVYAEVLNVPAPQTARISSRILLDLYADQTNLLHFKYKNKRQSASFKEDRVQTELFFD